MSLTTIVFLAVLIFFTWRGYQKGFIGAITRLVSLIIAYPSAIFLTKPFAAILHSWTGLDGIILYLIAGCTIFASVSLIVTLILNGIARLVPHNDFTQTSSKIGGAAFGLIIGSVFGLLAVYVVDIVIETKGSSNSIASSAQDPAQNNRQATSAEQESIKQYVASEEGSAPIGAHAQETFIDTSAKKLVGAAASTAIEIITDDKATSQITKSMAQDPQKVLKHVQNMTNNNELKTLLNKPDFQAELDQGDVQSLLHNDDFQQLVQNPDMQAIIASGDDETTGKSAEEATAEKMIQAWQKVSTLKNDPRVIAIMTDPAFQAQINSSNKLPLLMNPKMRELSEIIFSNDTTVNTPERLKQTKKNTAIIESHERYKIEDITNGTPQDTATETSETDNKKPEKTETKLYRWTDENGKVHFSDKPVKEKP